MKFEITIMDRKLFTLFPAIQDQCCLLSYILGSSYCKQYKSPHTVYSKTCLSLGRVAQSVTCLTTDACLTAIPGVASSIPAWSHTFVEIDHEIISTVILLPSADSFKKGFCQLQAKVCARITGYPLVQACPGKNVVR